jgi:hypothetical protein
MRSKADIRSGQGEVRKTFGYTIAHNFHEIPGYLQPIGKSLQDPKFVDT